MIVSPGEKWVIWTHWDNLGEILECFKQTQVAVGH